MLAEDAVGLAHGFEQEGEFAEEAAGLEAVLALQELAEDFLGEQADGVGEEAKEDAHEEVRDFSPGSVEAALFDFEAFGEAGELAGGILGDLGVGALGAEEVGVAEEGAEDGKGWERAGGGRFVEIEVVERESVDALRGGGEIGVDLETVEVTDDEQGRVAELFAVVVELGVGFFQVFVFAFVLQGKVVAEPNIGEALAAAGFGDGFLKGVALARGVAGGWVWLAEHVA